MDWTYLVLSLMGLAITLSAFHPGSRSALGQVVTFVTSWLSAELPLHQIGWQAIVTLLFARAGAFASWPGLLGLGISALSWGTLLFLFQQQRRTAEVVGDALRGGNGSNYAERIPEAMKPGDLDQEASLGGALLPFPLVSRSVEVLRDIEYGRERGIDLCLDIYRSRESGDNRPVLFQIHGGGWMMGLGSKRGQALPLMDRMARSGWLCVSVEYRLSPHATFPDHLVDLKRALVWVKENIAQYGGDPDFVMTTGGSAGGHLCAMLGLTINQSEYQPGFEEADTSVQGCAPFYGVYDLLDRGNAHRNQHLLEMVSRHVLKGSPEEIPEQWEHASPVSCIRDEAPAFFVLHGGADISVPVQESRNFVRRLAEKTHAPLVYAENPHAKHGFDSLRTLRSVPTVEAVRHFALHLYAKHQQANRTGP